MAYPSLSYTITNGTPNDATIVMQNFNDCINAMKDGTKDFSIAALTVGGILTLSSTISSALTPTTNTFYDMGTATKGWSSLYLGGSSTFTTRVKAGTMASSYTITLPTAVPASTLPVVMDTGGTLSTSTITRTQLASIGQQVSSSSGNFSTSSTSYVDVANLSISITTTGRPVFIGLMSGDTSNIGALRATVGSATTVNASYAILSNGSIVGHYYMHSGDTNTNAKEIDEPLGSVWFIDTPAAGTYTYKLQMKAGTGCTGYVQYAKLIAYEIA